MTVAREMFVSEDKYEDKYKYMKCKEKKYIISNTISHLILL